VRRLLRQRSARELERRFVIEGAKTLAVALEAGAPVDSVVWAPSRAEGTPAEEVACRAATEGATLHAVSAGVIERVADTVSPQPVLAVSAFVDVELDQLEKSTMLVVCAGVRDPGNAGSVLRSARAAGADGVICCGGSVDIYNPKTVRAAAGSLFHVPVVAGGDTVDVLERIGAWPMQRLGAVARGGADHDRCELGGRVAFVVGNEAHGLETEVGALLDGQVTIPMAAGAESLNVGVAAAVLCFEAARQRRAAEARQRSAAKVGSR
jgi:TrmH family RNA methyltransferase